MPIMYLPILFHLTLIVVRGAEALRLAQRQTTTLCPVIEVASVRCERWDFTTALQSLRDQIR